MEQNKLTPEAAIGVLDSLTDPRNSGKLTRADYANAEAALAVLAKLVKEASGKPADIMSS
jgi:hypothetical protein